MKVTKKLYDTDGNCKSFEARILECIPDEKYYRVILDQTAFFPEGGGQPSDTGNLNQIPVIDVKEEKGIVYHIVTEAFKNGERVKGSIDWEKRFSNMQNHSGEHIVSGLVKKYYGYDNVGFHMGREAITMDFNGILSSQDLVQIEQKANLVVTSNQPVLISFPDKEALKQIHYRSKIEIDDQIRIVEIPGVDCCACCAPHVKKTGEIGFIKLLSGQSYKGGTRVSMLCGFRALEDYRQKAEEVQKISQLLSVKKERIAEGVAQLKEDYNLVRFQLSEARGQIITYKTEKIPNHSPFICFFEQDIKGNDLRRLVNMAAEKSEDLCVGFTKTEDDSYQYVACSNRNHAVSFKEMLHERFCGHGGGKPKMVQGSVQGKEEELLKFVEKCAGELQQNL